MYTVDDTRDIWYGERWSVPIGRGKTEMQEDEVYDAPVRVELREVPVAL